jgi:hypothetical protein
LKKSFALILVALLAAAVVPTVSKADDLSAAQTAIDAVYKAQCAALVAGDADAWSKTVTPDYASTNPDGTVDTFDKSVANLKDAFGAYSFSSCMESITAVKQVGDNVVATGAFTASGKTVDTGAPIEVVQNEVDTWSNASGAWLQRADFVVEQKVTIDGKVVQDQSSTGTPPRNNG